ncbi:DUF1963 domain-containing protein [Clostridium intestinale]|uniref:DUF1963 domain-containing protein n=1 Tax=Clostridium intestinale TaxID=36845 RepID=UPI0028EC7BEC|nr:DUF1963 domain-containing protein [Clostridium intestinale]
MNDRIPCVNVGCKSTILQSTADRTGGYCMPCHQAIKRKEQEEFIRKNRKDINLYEGVNDPVEILKIMHTPKKYNPLENYIKYDKSMEEVYITLSEKDKQKMKAYVLSLIKDEEIEKAQDILLPLVCFRNANVEECLEALIEKGECYPEIVFKDAFAYIRDILISQVEQELNTINLNHALRALAWIGDKKVVDLFNKWRKEPPKWAEKLYVPPEQYSFEAGWELTEKGERRDLFYKDCYVIEKKKSSEEQPITFLEKHDEKCKWCGGDLTNLFSFDLTNSLFDFINCNNEKLNIPTCHVCNCYGPLYMDIDTRGTGHWSELNSKPEYLGDVSEDESIILKSPLRILKVKRSCFHASSELLETTFSQVGGQPTWIQDAEYPKCPKCSNYMKFIGQIDWADIEAYGEGIYHSFVCEECNIVATNYQQS